MPNHPLTIQMFPAREGDCLVVTHGDPRAPHRILVDGGRKATYGALREFLRGLPEHERVFDLLVVTHIDRDHIEGTLALLADQHCPVAFRDIWFNGYHHVTEGLLEFGAVQGNRLVDLLKDRPWNAAQGGGAIVVPEDGPAAPLELPGGARVTVLSPAVADLRALRRLWEQECRAAGLDPDTDAPDPDAVIEEFGRVALDVDALAAAAFVPDRTVPNGSSIAFLLAVDDRRILLTGDAHVDTLLASLRQLGGGPLKLDACKVSHHGSARNTSNDLLAAVDCPRWLFSSNGAQFKHPDAEAIARIVKHGGAGKTLYFNYRTAHTDPWDDPELKARHRYEAVYGADGALTVTL